VAHIFGVAAAYGAALAAGGWTGAPVTGWLLTVGAAAVSGAFVAQLLSQLRERAAEAAARAERLRAAERRTRSILETANEAFIGIDGVGLVISVNARAEELTGWSRGELVGRRVSETLIPDRLRSVFETELGAFVDGGRRPLLSRSIEFVALHRDGNEFPVELKVSSVREGEAWMFNAFFRDITERKLAERRMREQIEDLELVAGVARDLASVSDAHVARPGICRAAVELSGATVGVLFEPGRGGRELVSTAIYGARTDRIRTPLDRPSGAATALSSGEPLFVTDLAENPAVEQEFVRRLGVGSAYWQLILRNGVSVGVLAVAWEERMPRLSSRVGSLLEQLAAEAAVAIERADLLGRLEAVARTDDLTGLANRRAWQEHLPRELTRARRESKSLCVAMLDLDRFKAFNDRHGHPAGDRLLKEITATWRGMVRPSDLLARYGGEEFVLVLPGCELEEALEVVERLRTSVRGGQTCSAGVAEWDGVEGAEELVSRADRALYYAKEGGRDRAEVA
jgi:diguanylate cyclase (GGDEF)-like protein/PAS domain S-box-containing protein